MLRIKIDDLLQELKESMHEETMQYQGQQLPDIRYIDENPALESPPRDQRAHWLSIATRAMVQVLRLTINQR